MPTLNSSSTARSVRPRLLGSIVLAAGLAGCLLTAQAQESEYDTVTRLIGAGQFKAAMERAEAHLASKPKDAQMAFIKGVIQTQSGQPEQAMGTFTRLTLDFPELPEPHNNLAVLHAAQHDYDKARSALEMAIRLNPGYATAHRNLGDVYLKLAARSYAHSLELDAGNPTLAGRIATLNSMLQTQPVR